MRVTLAWFHVRSFTWDYVREGESEGGSVSAGVERVLLDPEVESKLLEQQLLTEREKNKIAQGDVNIFSHLKFSFTSTFLPQTKKNVSKLIQAVMSIFRIFLA